ncbi:restriction endonuclease subunit S [Listeria innocua]|uniref:restriction endonuclease subunit S n=1 Tax=Listeria innocua TaxID=1642 RepID=UPI001943724B|nr:restriction endonuclease subunit S [Listeria innocua]EKO3230480.1 restriction endonuclease subunit S [Listeria innocua]MBM5696690.1 restriction endonuclease subunit S [Listeria innocua]HBM3434965.1 restriction endonuclease subunit S [Listeria innocua]HBM4503635.1 restriction endonuclease subunit S [Listeria innocua]HDI0348371.1 restriction endonuclease subunit S [Listeria innocua]
MLPLFYLISHYSNLPIRAWEQRKLGEDVNFLNGRAYSQKELLDKGKYKVLRVGNFNTNDRWYYSDLELEENKYANRGDLLYLWATNFGPEIWNQEKVIYHYHIWKLKIMNINVSKQYLYTWLITDKERIKQSTNGTTMVHVTKSHIEQREFQIPPNLTEQQKIGDFFKQLDDTIALHQRKLDALKLMKKGFLQQMFPKSEENVPKLRVSNFAGEWEQRKAGNIFMTISDKNHAHLPVLSASQELGMIRRDNIGINIKYNEKSLKNYKLVKPGQFVIHLRSFQGGFAWSYITGITSPAYTILDYKEPQKNVSKFWKEVLTSPIFIKRLETITYGIRDGRSISFADFSTLKFSAPSVDEQRKISAFFQQLDNNTTIQQNKLEKLISLKEAYLQNMFI